MSKDSHINAINIEDLYSQLLKKYIEGVEFVSFDHDLISNFTITLKGELWNGEYIDARSAKYILELQKAFQQILTREITLTQYRGKEKPLIKVRIKKGSLEYVIEVLKFFEPYLNKMNSTDLTIVIVVFILSALGAYSVKKISETFESVKAKNSDKEISKKIADILERSIESSKIANETIRSLSNQMNKNDEASFSLTNKTYSSDEMKRMFPRRKPSMPLLSYADGVYEIANIDFENETLDLIQNNDLVEAQIIMSSNDANKFYDEIKKEQSINKNVLPKMILQVDVMHNAYGIKNATVVGVGKIRENSKNISLFIKKQKI